MSTLILASTSPYRRELLSRLGLPFEVARPEVDEHYLDGESPPDRALRLSLAKARAVADLYPKALVIGSDQVAAVDNRILDKPGDAQNARAQLRALSGRTARFYTGCAIVARQATLQLSELAVTTAVFRTLSEGEIDRYVAKEPAFDCAGGAKAEGLGVALVERIESTDPTALIGLPLIWVAQALRSAGFRVP